MILDVERDALAAMSRRLATTSLPSGTGRLRHRDIQDAITAVMDISHGSDGQALEAIEGARSKLANAMQAA